jgi:ACR3 family arsenite transporter
MPGFVNDSKIAKQIIGSSTTISCPFIPLDKHLCVQPVAGIIAIILLRFSLFFICLVYNDLILLIAFIPIVGLLFTFFGLDSMFSQTGNIGIPYDTLITSVIVFVVIPLLAGYFSHKYLMKTKGEIWFKDVFLAKLKPISISALLLTLVLLFAFQGQKIIDNPFHILLIAIPLTLQTYFIFFVSWFIGKYLKLSHQICAPAAMIGASNFFELAVAVAIALFGLNSGASLATVVGVLIEVPVMLSLVALANKWRY